MVIDPILFDLNFRACVDLKLAGDLHRDLLWQRESDTLANFHLKGFTIADSFLGAARYSFHLSACCFTNCFSVASGFGCDLNYSNRLFLYSESLRAKWQAQSY